MIASVSRWMLALVAVAGLACFTDGGDVVSSGSDTTSGGSDAGSASVSSSATTSTASTSGSDATTAGGSASDASTSGTSGTSGTTSTTSTTAATTTTTGDVAQELLQHVDPELCDGPLWCLDNNDVPPPTRSWAQECYQSALAPPLTIEQVRWTIGGAVGLIGESQPALEVYSFSDLGPTELLASVDLGVDAVSVGAHTMALADPIVIDAASFCIGLVGGSAMSPSALGVAIGAPLEPNRSYIKIIGAQSCDLASFVDITDLPSNPAGSWCIGAMVSGG